MHQQRIDSSKNMRNYSHTSEQGDNDKSPETNPEVTEICNLSDGEFKIVVIKKLNKVQENPDSSINSGIKLKTKGIETLKRNQRKILQMKNKMNEIKKILETLKNRTDIMEDRISDLKDRNIEMLQVEEKRELRYLKNEEILQGKSSSIRKCNIKIIGITEGEE